MTDLNSIKNALVIGGGGFLGRALVLRLLAEGVETTGFSRSRYPELEADGASWISGDIRDADAVRAACGGRDAVFHTAAKAGVWGAKSAYYAVNVIGTQNVVKACLAKGVSALVYTSSPSVVFNGRDMENIGPITPYPKRYLCAYPQTKAAAEKCVRTATKKGLCAVILRPHLIWGPGDPHLTPRILSRARRLARIGGKNPKIDATYIDNAALAHVLAARALFENPGLSGRVYFIAQNQPMGVWDMINGILAAGGRRPVTHRIPEPLAYGAGAFLEAVYGLFRVKKEPPVTRFVVKELSTAHWFDLSGAQKDLGYAPVVDVETGLLRLSKWLKENRMYA